MTVFSFVIDGLLLGVIIGIAAYGWVTLPADARVPVHYGLGSYNTFASKTVGLLMWPVGGLLIFGVFTALTQNAVKPNHPGPLPAPLVILPIVLAVVAAAEWGAIAAARRNSAFRQ